MKAMMKHCATPIHCYGRFLRAFLFWLLFAAESSILAGEYYVALNGSDDNDGSINRPWQTIMHAARNTAPGDTIFIRGGTYPEQEEIWLYNSADHGGAPGKWKTIMAYPGERAELSQRLIVDADYVRVKGLAFRNNILNVAEWDGPTSHVEILDNVFTGSFNSGAGALNFKGSNGLIAGNRLELTGRSDDHGIYVMSGANNIVRNNYISGSPQYGVHIYDEDKYESIGQFDPKITNLLVENNIIIGSQTRSGIIISAGESSSKAIAIDSVIVRNNLVLSNAQNGLTMALYGTIRNVRIYNNVFYKNMGAGIYINARDADDIRIINNIFASNRSSQISLRNVEHFVISNNLYWNPNSAGEGIRDNSPVLGDPLFANPANLNFRLKSSSPAIEAGMDVGIPFEGSAPDIGAFEYWLSTGVVIDAPIQYNIRQNYPNPFNPKTKIVYEIPLRSQVKLNILNVLGKEIAVLIDREEEPGLHSVVWDGRNAEGKEVGSGIYFYTVAATFNNDRAFSETRKMLLIR